MEHDRIKPRKHGGGGPHAEQLAQASGDQVAFVHCVEGGFHLGSTPDEIDEAVSTLARRGVAYITLAHLVWRHVATNTNALPFLSEGDYRRWFPQPEEGLSELGRAAVRAMVREGVLIDLSHMSGRSVTEPSTYSTSSTPRTRPVLASHACFRFGSQITASTSPAGASRAGCVVGLILAQHQLRDACRFERRASTVPSRSFACTSTDREITDPTSTRRSLRLRRLLKPTMAGLQSMSDLAKLESGWSPYARRAEFICSANALRLLRAGWGQTLDA